MPVPEQLTAPRLSAIRSYLETSLYLLLLTAALTLSSTGKLDLLSTVVPPLAVLFRAVRGWRGYGPELSHRAATWLVAAYFVFFPFDLWIVSRVLAAGAPNPVLYAALLAAIHLMLFAMVVRLYSATTPRHYLFLTLLAFAMVLAAAILTVSTAFLVFFLLFLVLCVSTFVGLEMRRSAEGAASAPLESGTSAARRLHRALSWLSASVAFSALVVGAAIFFLIPRFTAGYLGGFNLQPTLISGFSDNVELGQIGEIKKSDAVVMRARIEGAAARRVDFRWRGIALTTFDGKRWYTSNRETRALLPGADGWYQLGLPSPALRRAAVRMRYTVLLEPMATDALFLPATAEAVRGRFTGDTLSGTRGPRRSFLLLDRTSSLYNPFHNYAKLRYEGLSFLPVLPAERLRAASTDYPEEIRAGYLETPPLDPRIPALAREVTARAPTPYDKAVAIQQYLRARYGYTLDLSGTPGADPLAHFLFERRAGHCEYFASAMTVMLRTLGIPARYVNGFLPGEYNEVGEDYIVRARDAHSWVEAYFPEIGWIPFDPTPPTEEQPQSWLGGLALYWDWFVLTWDEWVINYDFLHQVTLAQNLQRASRAWTEEMRARIEQAHRSAVERLKRLQARAVETPYALPAGLGALLLLLGLLRGREIGRRFALLWAMHVRPRPEFAPHLALLHYQRMLRILAGRGMVKRDSQTPQEFAASLAGRELALPVEQLTELYQAARFGAGIIDPKQMGNLLEAIRARLRCAHRFR